MSFIASAVAAGFGLAGAGKQADGVANGLSAQTAATGQAQGALTSAYGDVRANDQPWMTAGTGALSQMGQMTAAGPPQFTSADFLANKDPAYGFDMQQGLNGVQASAAANGKLMSGGTLAALNNYGQGMASNEYSNAYNRFMGAQNTQFSRLSSIAGMGLNATGMSNNAAMSYGNGMAGLATGLGNATAGADVATGNIWGGAISNIGSGLANNMSVGGMMSQMNGKSPYGNSLSSMGGGGGGGGYMPAGAADPSMGGTYGASALSEPALGSSAYGGGSSMSLLAGS